MLLWLSTGRQSLAFDEVELSSFWNILLSGWQTASLLSSNCSLVVDPACAALLPFGLHVQHHYSVYQFSRNALPLMATGPRPLASKARRPPGGSAVPSVECPPPNTTPQVRGNIINSGPWSFRHRAEASATPVCLLFDGLPLRFNSNSASEHHSCAIIANKTWCPEVIKHLSECDGDKKSDARMRWLSLSDIGH